MTSSMGSSLSPAAASRSSSESWAVCKYKGVISCLSLRLYRPPLWYARAILDWRANGAGDMADLSASAVGRMQEFGLRYPHAGYGGAFRRWLEESRSRPYNSWGNGAAMRVSACGRAIRRLAEVPRRRNCALGTRVFDDRQVAVVGEEMVKYERCRARCAA